MLDLGQRAGRETVCVLTDMDQPLGGAVGNALEVREARATIRGEGPADFTELVLASSAHLLALSDLDVDEVEGRRRAEQAVVDGSASATWERWIAAQGGDPAEDALPTAPVVREVAAPQDGVVTRLGAVAVGHAAMRLGAGRMAKDDEIDHAVGVVCHAKRGDAVVRGDVLADVHARDDRSAADACDEVLAAYAIGDDAPERKSIVLETLV
jgi:pyrimidine-nucleoside phosphorylase